MRQIVVISGKGGTGKTVLTASFAALAKSKVMADCDVDAADLHLLLHPIVKQRYEFRSGKTAVIKAEVCKQCGKCIDVCRFEAINGEFIVNSISCEGCGICSYICPVGAIEMQDNISGEWYICDTQYGPFVHAKLGIAQENSGKLVTKVKQKAKEIAIDRNMDYIIIDGPPGIGCPVVASLSETDLALIVTEPTQSGIHDMQRIMEVVEHFNITAKVAVNKYDLNPQKSNDIKSICQDRNIELVGLIPFSKKVSQSIVRGVPMVEYVEDEVSREIILIWQKIR
jgi:MinD superfamily P-loop ATPase